MVFNVQTFMHIFMEVDAWLIVMAGRKLVRLDLVRVIISGVPVLVTIVVNVKVLEVLE